MTDAAPAPASDPSALATDPDVVRRRLRERLDPAEAPTAVADDLRPAAVLVPVVRVDGRPHLLFLQRPLAMREHAGQIAFPGGRIDVGESPVEAALREAEEELGLRPDHLELLGRDRGIPTMTRYFVHPIVAWFDEPPPLRPNPREVDDTFFADLATLLDPSVYDGRPVEAGDWRGVVHYFHYPQRQAGGDPRVIWGATGRLLADLFGRVFDWRPPGPWGHLPGAS